MRLGRRLPYPLHQEFQQDIRKNARCTRIRKEVLGNGEHSLIVKHLLEQKGHLHTKDIL